MRRGSSPWHPPSRRRRLRPALRNTGRGAHERDQLVRVDGQGVPVAAVLEVVARHPVILARREHVLDHLAEVAAVQLRAAGARRADVADRKPLVERHRDERRLAVPRVALDADASGIDSLVRLEVVERAAGAPRPCLENAPVVQLARLTPVDEPDDPLRQIGAVVGLNAGRARSAPSPSLSRAPAAATIPRAVQTRQSRRPPVHVQQTGSSAA